MLQSWPIVLTVSGLAISALFARAVRGHFVSDSLPPAMKFLVAVSYLAIFVYLFTLWTGDAKLWQRVAGLSLQIFAAGLFNWAKNATFDNRLTAAFDIDKPIFLMKSGPYRFVRHPFYASYIAFWVGSSLAANSVFLYIICFALVVAYVIAALFEESKFKNSPFAADYQRYSRQTGFLFPRFPALSKEDRRESQPPF
jgi:protein-S-isoprenylcysteine O-methyltransferase Ste14